MPAGTATAGRNTAVRPRRLRPGLEMAARRHWHQATALDLDRVGIYLGSGEGSLDFDTYTAPPWARWQAEASADRHGEMGADGLRAHERACASWSRSPTCPCRTWRLLTGAAGPAFNCLTACAASTQAIGEATEILRRGDADVMISGGAHSMIHPFGVTGFNRLTALSHAQRRSAKAPAARSTANRDGFVLGEGAGMVILEELEHAQTRGAKILGRDRRLRLDRRRLPHHRPGPRRRGRHRGHAGRPWPTPGCSPADIDYINAHGTGTKENDSIETLAIKQVFGERAEQGPGQLASRA